MTLNKLRIFSLFVLSFLLVAWNTPKRAKVFLIGDSISVQYFPYLKQYLSNFADIERKMDNGRAEKNLDVPAGANGGDSRMVFEYLRSRFKDPDFRPDYLLLNCGLHDIKHHPETGAIQVTEDNYRKNLEAIVSLLRANHVKPVWIRTTYVVDSIHNTRSKDIVRYAEDVIKYNSIADEIFLKHEVPLIDLYSFSVRQGVEHVMDHVHYDLSTRALQAAYITGFMQNIICSKQDKLKQ